MWITSAANANIMLERPAGCSTNCKQDELISNRSRQCAKYGLTFSRLSNVSNTSPASGSSLRGRGWVCATLREYGVPALPKSGIAGLLFPPSALRYEKSGPMEVSGGWGRSS